MFCGLKKKCGKKANELKIGIGRDARITGEKLALAAAEGISSTGAKVVNCGLATTPAMFMSIVFDQTKFDGSLMITASHLPFNRNGIKFFNVDGGLEHEDIEEILKTAQNLTPQKNSSPFAENFDLLSIYAEHLKQTICKELNSTESEKPLAGLKIVVDAGNGDAGFFVDKILIPLGANTEGSEFLEPDECFQTTFQIQKTSRQCRQFKRPQYKTKQTLG